jgi:hypothetical protein
MNASTDAEPSTYPSYQKASTFREHWGVQAWYDWLAYKYLLRSIDNLIPHTYVPALRLLTDWESAQRAYETVLAQDEKISFWDSPREKWRKRYGNYVRQMEWVCGELKKILPPHEYEQLIAWNMANGFEACFGGIKPRLASMLARQSRSGPGAAGPLDGVPGMRKKPGLLARLGQKLMNSINVAGFMIGDIEIRRVSDGEIEFYIPRCAMHTVVSETKTQDECCVQGCKVTCERVFDAESPIQMEFDPKLPGFDCVLWVRWGEKRAPLASSAQAHTA